MTLYCSCNTCSHSPAQPRQRAQGTMEMIPGALVAPVGNWTLAHWSSVSFTDMMSTEIHRFDQDGYKPRVGISFYLYTGAVPSRRPKQLELAGLGGSIRYTIDAQTAQQLGLRVFYKNNATANPAEVAVMIGCGGTISFDAQRQATAATVQANQAPVGTITLPDIRVPRRWRLPWR